MEKIKRNRWFAQTSLMEVEHERRKRAMRLLHPHSRKAFDLLRWPNRDQIPDQRGHKRIVKPTGSLPLGFVGQITISIS